MQACSLSARDLCHHHAPFRVDLTPSGGALLSLLLTLLLASILQSFIHVTWLQVRGVAGPAAACRPCFRSRLPPPEATRASEGATRQHRACAAAVLPERGRRAALHHLPGAGHPAALGQPARGGGAHARRVRARRAEPVPGLDQLDRQAHQGEGTGSRSAGAGAARRALARHAASISSPLVLCLPSPL